MRGCTGDDQPDRVQAVGARSQRRTRLEAQVALAQVRVVFGDVGRVGNDHAVDVAGHRLEPAALQQAQRQAGLVGVGARHRQGGIADVHGADIDQGAFAGDRQGDGAGAGAQVEHLTHFGRRQAFERQFHQQFGLRPRDQRVGRYRQFQRPEAAVAGDLRHRFTALAPSQQRVEVPRLAAVEHIAGVGVEPAARTLQRVRQQQLGLEPGLVAGQARGGFADGVGQGRHFSRPPAASPGQNTPG